MDPKNITILLVEDAAVMRKIELKTLKSLGFETIIEAADGEIAVVKLQENEKIKSYNNSFMYVQPNPNQ